MELDRGEPLSSPIRSMLRPRRGFTGGLRLSANPDSCLQGEHPVVKMPNAEPAVVEHEGGKMTTDIQLLDVVALTEDRPDRGLRRGQVGTVVELLAPNVFEVEFSDDQGRSYATLALQASEVMPLHYHPVETD
jgi:hypothetical protein